jgi:hypothetical protein
MYIKFDEKQGRPDILDEIHIIFLVLIKYR